MFFALHPMESISLNSIILLDTDFNTRNKLLTQTLLKQCYRYHKLRKTFSKFCRRYYDLISKFQVGLKTLLRQGLSEPEFYGDLVYKLKKCVGSNIFSAQFIKIISHYKKSGYNINVLKQTACLVVNPITVGKLSKGAKIRNRYNQVPHLTQYSNWESDKLTIRLYDGSDLKTYLLMRW